MAAQGSLIVFVVMLFVFRETAKDPIDRELALRRKTSEGDQIMAVQNHGGGYLL